LSNKKYLLRMPNRLGQTIIKCSHLCRESFGIDLRAGEDEAAFG
jgi:hypothetical protein